MSVEVTKHDKLSALVNQDVHKILLKNNNGFKVELLTLGGAMTLIEVPNRERVSENVLLTYSEDSDYIENAFYLNASIGPAAGRIRNGAFTIDDVTYKLPINNGISCLHGGPEGFHTKVWEIDSFEATGAFKEVVLKHRHVHLEDGFPGNIVIKALYRLTEENEILIRYEAQTDRSCLLNLANHNYYNLSGNAKTTIHDHLLFINAEYYKEKDDFELPIEELVEVRGTDFDFSEFAPIGQALKRGMDNPFAIEFKLDEGAPDIIYKDPLSGRVMSIKTNQEAVVVYSNNGPYQTHKGICFETQGYPNQIYVLDPDETYTNWTTIKFGIE